MTFIKSIETCLTKYIDFNGRASRSEYWWFILFVTVCWIIGFALGPVIELVILLGLLLPTIAVCARRLHDIDKTGWLQLIQIIPLIGGIILIIWCATEGAQKKNKYGKPIKINK
tara:strand:+ start:1278 stop:1619 length:342 start_codon:yes stop_codon:yes gene_type:complete